MMNMKEKLDLLALADGFTVKLCIDCFEVRCQHSELMAAISLKGDIEYYKELCGHSCEELIDIDALLKLKEFCEALVR